MRAICLRYITTNTLPSGVYGWYYRRSQYVGIKILKPNRIFGIDSRTAAEQELSALRAAYPSGITPRPFGLVRVLIEDWDEEGFTWYWGVAMQHIDGRRYEAVHSCAIDYDDWCDMKEALLSAGVVLGDWHGGNVMEDNDGKLWRIDVSLQFMAGPGSAWEDPHEAGYIGGVPEPEYSYQEA